MAGVTATDGVDLGVIFPFFAFLALCFFETLRALTGLTDEADSAIRDSRSWATRAERRQRAGDDTSAGFFAWWSLLEIDQRARSD